MAQVPYRGNLSAKVFPFLSSQFGRSVIVAGIDQVNASQTGGESSGGDSNIPQAYYMHNVIPTAQGYKSVGYKNILPAAGFNFDKVFTVRDPDMVRGWLGVTTSGALYLYRAGDITWTDITAQVTGWTGGNVSIAYANGYTYLCLAGFNVYKLSVAAKTVTVIDLIGVVENKIVAITASSNYLVITDGVTIFWSSTISPEDFVPSLITGAGSGKPSDLEGLIVALVPLTSGFAVYSSVNVVIASYSQNARFPWVYRGAANSEGVSDIQHITVGADEGTHYAWTSAGIQKISNTGAAVTSMPEVTDFLVGYEFEDFNSLTNTLVSSYSTTPFKLKLAFIAARYLVISYGVDYLTHALVYDTSLKRWGKLKLNHAACFEVTLNSDGKLIQNTSPSAKKTLGFVLIDGSVTVCNFENNANISDSVLILGKFQLIRSRLVTMDHISLESVDTASDFSVLLVTSLDGKSPIHTPLQLSANKSSEKFREYPAHATGVNHSLVLKGKFHLNSFLLNMHVNGRR